MQTPTAESSRRVSDSSVLAFVRSRSGLILLLALSLLMRIIIFRSIDVRTSTDTVSYLVLHDLHPVRTPGYPMFIETIAFLNDLFSISADSLRLIVFFQIFLLGMVNTYLIFRFAKILTRSEAWAVALGLLFNLDYFVIGFEFILLTETLALTFLGLTLFFYWKIFESRGSAPFLAGLFSVGLILTRPTFTGLFVCLLVLTLLIYRRQMDGGHYFRRFGRALAIFLVVNLVGIGSWSLRNKVKYGFFGLSTIMPYQLSYYTNSFYWKYKAGSDEELDKYARIMSEERGSPYNIALRLAEEFKLQPAQVSRILLRLNLKLIKENFGDYLKLMPRAAGDYYTYSQYWTRGNNGRVLGQTGWLGHALRFFSRVYSFLFGRMALLLILILVLPIAFLIARRKDKEAAHLIGLFEGAIHYSFIVSVLLTNNGVNNQRFRAPLEPFILLVFWSALIVFGSELVRRLGRIRAAE